RPIAIVQLRGSQAPHGWPGTGIREHVGLADHERGLVPVVLLGTLVATARAMGPIPSVSAASCSFCRLETERMPRRSKELSRLVVVAKSISRPSARLKTIPARLAPISSRC